jgi:hypothetical protein
MKILSRHTDLLYEFVTSLLTKGIQMGKMSKLGWHAIWADSLYFLYLPTQIEKKSTKYL